MELANCCLSTTRVLQHLRYLLAGENRNINDGNPLALGRCLGGEGKQNLGDHGDRVSETQRSVFNLYFREERANIDGQVPGQLAERILPADLLEAGKVAVG